MPRHVQRYKKRIDYEREAHNESLRRTEALLGKPWDTCRAKECREWLKRDAVVDAHAFAVLRILTEAADAAKEYFVKYPAGTIQQREKRLGLRAKVDVGENETRLYYSIDPETLPPDAPQALAADVDHFRGMASVETLRLLVQGYEMSVQWVPRGPEAVPPVSFNLRYLIEPVLGGSFGLVLRILMRESVNKLIADTARFRDLLDMPREAPMFSEALGIVALFDRPYKPGELRCEGRLSKDGPLDRLSDAELGAISILMGRMPTMPPSVRGYSAAEVIAQAGKNLASVRDTLQKLREAGVPIPRVFTGSATVSFGESGTAPNAP